MLVAQVSCLLVAYISLVLAYSISSIKDVQHWSDTDVTLFTMTIVLGVTCLLVINFL